MTLPVQSIRIHSRARHIHRDCIIFQHAFNSSCVIRFLSAAVPADLFDISIKFELLDCSTIVIHHVCLYLCCSSYCCLWLVFVVMADKTHGFNTD